MRGLPPAPRRRLHPLFAAAVQHHPEKQYVLGLRAGWTQGYALSWVLQPATVLKQTPLLEERLRRLADLVGYDGEIFLGEPLFTEPRVGR